MRVRNILALAVVLASVSVAGAEDLNVLTGQAGTLLNDYLRAQATKQFNLRRNRVAKVLKSPAAIREYQKQRRKKYREILGTFPEKTSLRPEVTGTIKCEGYRIEKVAYQSRPNHYVTANLYVPTTGSSPYPAVLVLCGHAAVGKAYGSYQRVCILLAKNGLAALIVDPISQGERVQILDDAGEPVKEDGVYLYVKRIFEHSLIDYGARLVGTSTVAYELWDNIRSIDYLLSRPEVDPTKIGCTGNSGGGTQTTFLMGFDDRIGPAAPACYISTLEWVFAARQFDDACQHLAGEGAAGFERADYIAMRAPKPTLVLAATRDRTFNIKSTRLAFQDARRFYKRLGYPDRVALFEGDHSHGFHPPLRRKAVQWMKRWLLKDDRPVSKPDLTVQKEKDLWVTRTGQTGSHWKNALLVPDLNLLRAKTLASQRERFWKENSSRHCLAKVKRLIGLRDHRSAPRIQHVGTIRREGYRIEKLKIARPREVPLPGLLFVPDDSRDPLSAVLYVHGRGKHADATPEGPLARLVKAGNVVFAIDVRGFGETKNTRRYRYASYMYSDDYPNNMLAMHLGRPLLGQRVEDVLTALDVLAARKEVNAKAIRLVGIGRAGPVALHAAALDPRFVEVTIRESIITWIDIVRAPLARRILTHIVPSALLYYDLPDLVRAIAPRSVRAEKVGGKSRRKKGQDSLRRKKGQDSLMSSGRKKGGKRGQAEKGVRTH